MHDKRALIVGVTGIVGNNLARHLVRSGDWSVHGIARTAPRGLSGVEPVCVDVLDAAATSRALAALAPSHVFLCTWTRMPTEAENCRVNGAMVRHVLDAVGPSGAVRHVALVTGTKTYLGPFEMYARNRPETPFREDQPRLPIENFYYVQEDAVFEAAERYGFGWSVHRPHTIVGYAVGNAMNIGVTLAVYASICKETGRPFLFPGSPVQHTALADVTDARLLARHLAWAATAPAARNEAFNVANGDVFRWARLWGVIARYFGLEPAPYPGEAVPLQQQMRDDGPVWDRMVARYGLQPNPLDRLASAWHTDADLGRPIECVNDLSKSRRLGFLDHQDTERSFLDLFDQLRQERVIP
ncbi:SDR family oxidoreductase [Azospirillum halopraeferens]|uniref:SDR family oxidoreductase n=1 Tax=Azospirillum halopraeferens TaxID=34010 RepID=UPI0004225CC4|nr:SDR family oxidoreductase [Azospirillum halopraeferens]